MESICVALFSFFPIYPHAYDMIGSGTILSQDLVCEFPKSFQVKVTAILTTRIKTMFYCDYLKIFSFFN